MHLPSSKGILADPGHPAIANRPAPPLTVASLNLKTVIHAGTQQHEVRRRPTPGRTPHTFGL